MSTLIEMADSLRRMPHADPDLVATVDRLVAAGESPRLVEAAVRYAEADAAFSRLLKAACATEHQHAA